MEPINPVRWGVLGAANIAVAKVIPSMQRGQLSRVVAIASRSLEKSQRAAANLGIARAYGSYEELLGDPDVEAIYNPLPNHLHVPWSIRALEAGKHVLCEKPIAMNADEARDLQAAATRAGRLVGEAFMVRSHPQWHTVKALVDGGEIGGLQLVHGHFSYARRTATDVRSNVEWGGGVLYDIGCYPITIARWMFGREPIAAVAAIERDPEYGVDRLTSGMLRFDGGHATFTVGGQMAAYQQIQLFGERGKIDVEIPFTPSATTRAKIVVNNDVRELDAVDQYTLQGDEFSAAIRGTGAVPSTIENAIANMAVVDALFRSAESGRWEDLKSSLVASLLGMIQGPT
jgi:predicted dehydrogenase